MMSSKQYYKRTYGESVGYDWVEVPQSYPLHPSKWGLELPKFNYPKVTYPNAFKMPKQNALFGQGYVLIQGKKRLVLTNTAIVELIVKKVKGIEIKVNKMVKEKIEEKFEYCIKNNSLKVESFFHTEIDDMSEEFQKKYHYFRTGLEIDGIVQVRIFKVWLDYFQRKYGKDSLDLWVSKEPIKNPILVTLKNKGFIKEKQIIGLISPVIEYDE